MSKFLIDKLQLAQLFKEGVTIFLKRDFLFYYKQRQKKIPALNSNGIIKYHCNICLCRSPNENNKFDLKIWNIKKIIIKQKVLQFLISQCHGVFDIKNINQIHNSHDKEIGWLLSSFGLEWFFQLLNESYCQLRNCNWQWFFYFYRYSVLQTTRIPCTS